MAMSLTERRRTSFSSALTRISLKSHAMCEYKHDPEFINSHITICHQRIQKGSTHLWHDRKLS